MVSNYWKQYYPRPSVRIAINQTYTVHQVFNSQTLIKVEAHQIDGKSSRNQLNLHQVSGNQVDQVNVQQSIKAISQTYTECVMSR